LNALLDTHVWIWLLEDPSKIVRQYGGAVLWARSPAR
jgi:PIN domain nuclease of toxin-antitoxin system